MGSNYIGYPNLSIVVIFISQVVQQPLVGQGLLIIEASGSHSDTPHSVRLSPTQRRLPDKTQHSQETDIHAPGGVRTHDPSKRAAANPRLDNEEALAH